MVRNYRRNTQPPKVPVDVIEKGINDVIGCGRSIRSVTNEIKINHMTLCRYIKKAKELRTENVERFRENTYKPILQPHRRTY